MSLLPLAFLLSTAHAVPTQMGHQGRVLDADGLPAEGPYTLDFHLYDAAEEGTMVWSELHDVDLISGYYSLVLGADELGNPLEDELLRDYELYLELTVGDDEALSPRQALNAVPYARLSATATSVNGGPVNASEVSIGGALVIDSSGAWVGTTPTMSWSDLSGVPEDVDTVLSEDEVDAFCADNGYAIASDLAAVSTSGSWSDLSDTPEDVDTVLSEDEVDAFCSDNGYAMASLLAAVATTGSWVDLRHVPTDVDTILSEDEVDAFCANNGYAMASEMSTMAAETNVALETMASDMAASIESLEPVATTGSYDDLTDQPAAVGVNAVHFTESGTFSVPDGVTSLIVYATGGGGGGSNGESTTLDLASHSHEVGAHSHSGGTHNHESGEHTHSESAGTTTTWDACATSSSCGGCYGAWVVSGGGSTTTSAASGITGEAEISTGAAPLTTNETDAGGGSVTTTGGDGGSGGGLSAMIQVPADATCEISIGNGGDIGEAGTNTTVDCGTEHSILCTAGAGGAGDGSNGLDGGCTSTSATVLNQFKASNTAPGGGGLGSQLSEALSGQSGSVTIRY